MPVCFEVGDVVEVAAGADDVVGSAVGVEDVVGIGTGVEIAGSGVVVGVGGVTVPNRSCVGHFVTSSVAFHRDWSSSPLNFSSEFSFNLMLNKAAQVSPLHARTSIVVVPASEPVCHQLASFSVMGLTFHPIPYQ